MIQVGSKFDETYEKNTQMAQEIIPQKNPYQMQVGDEMIVKVLFKYEPLTNKIIVAWHKTDTEKTTHQKLKTDADGMLKMKLDKAGYWMISTVHVVEVKNNPDGNYQSYWGNLTFSL